MNGQNAKGESARQSAVMAVRNEVIDRLQNGRLFPGQRIVTSELAQEMGLSRGPVREALHILAGEGIVELLRNRGARIRPITKKDILSVLDLLSALGGLAINLGAQMMEEKAKHALMKENLDRVTTAVRSRNTMRFYQAVQDFHHTLNSIVDNFPLSVAFAHLHMEYFNRSLAAILPGDHWDLFEQNYREIGKHLLAGDADEARAAYHRHMEWAKDLIRAEVAD